MKFIYNFLTILFVIVTLGFLNVDISYSDGLSFHWRGWIAKIEDYIENKKTCNKIRNEIWKPYTADSQLEDRKLYLVAANSLCDISGYSYLLCKYAEKLCEVDSYDFPENEYNHSGFYFYEYGEYIERPNVRFYMDIPKIPQLKDNI